MNKRGQIYLVAAIIVCMIAFVLVAKSNYIREQVLLQNFKDISSNYLTESPKVVNGVLENQESDLSSEDKLTKIKEELSGFTKDFVDNYAKNQDPNVGLIYIYNDENGVIIQNSLNGEKVSFVGSSNDNILLSYDEPLTGDIVFVGTGTSVATAAPLCNSGNEKYCILEANTLPPGKYNLNIGNINYPFEINQDSPELIVIVKSSEGNTVKVDVSENKL